jgi:hypothetical protein
MAKRYVVELSDKEREGLEAMLAKGRAAARKLTRARILLQADQGPAGPAWTDGAIAAALDVGRATVERVRKRLVEEGLGAAIGRRARPARPRKMFGEQEAHPVALACSAPPAGHERWTLRLLAERMVELASVEARSHETVRPTLKKPR